MENFNNNFYKSNTSYTREIAEKLMIENGYTDFQFKGCSFANGASFYFDVNGQEVRVSDHTLTGKRAFDVIQISFVKKSVFSAKKTETNDVSEFSKRLYAQMLAKGAITEEEYLAKIAG